MNTITKGFQFFLLLLFFNLNAFSQDHSLEYYISRGVENNPGLKDLSNQIRSNQYDSLITRASYLPQVNFNAYMMYAPVSYTHLTLPTN